MGGGLLLLLGLFCCVVNFRLYNKAIINPHFNPSKRSRIQQVGGLFLGQLSLLLITFALFYFLEHQSQTNPRLHGVANGYFNQILQRQPIHLGLQPWILSSVLGVGLAYLSICVNKKPILSRVWAWKSPNKMKYFLRNLLIIATDVVSMAPFVIIISFATVWLCETVGVFFGWDSLFLTPIRTLFIAALIMVVFRKSNAFLIDWMNQYKVSVAKTSLIYILAFSFFFLWLNGSAIVFLVGQEATTKVAKSQLAGYFSPQALENKITYLIWGWWYIWTPWLSALIARASIGFSIPRALLHSVIVPVGVFCWGLPKISATNWASSYQWFSQLNIQVLSLSGLFIFIATQWGKMRALGDVAKGAMLDVNKTASPSLKRWMAFLTVWLGSYMLGWFMLGWLPLQIMVSLGGIFMSIVITAFIAAWGTFLFRQGALKKYKAQA